MTPVSAVDRIRLAALLGMLGSMHVGERENAAKLVEQFRQRHGLTWTDLLVRPSLTRDPYGPQPSSANPGHAADRSEVGQASGREVVWRWSMLGGLVAVGLISLMTLIQQHEADRTIIVQTSTETPCLAAPQDGTPPTCGPSSAMPHDVKAASAIPVAAASARTLPSTPFAQGVADRKLSDTWHASESPALCAGRLLANQRELKAACLSAQKLLSQFEQRRRTDVEYRRGWNSLSS